jgi:rhodanese-related sulfurtransferase
MVSMRRAIQRSVVIVLVGAALGLAANAVSSHRIPFLTPPKAEALERDFIPLSQAHDLWATGAMFFLDARAPQDYEEGHIANALSLPVGEFSEQLGQVAPFLSADSVIVCYCDGMECDLSHNLAKLLREQGYTNVRILKNGWTEWKQAGYPTNKGAKP